VSRALDGGAVSLPVGTAVRVLAVGKAAPAMAEACVTVLAARVRAGIVISTSAPHDVGPLVAMASSHPVPDERSVEAGRAALALAESTPPGDRLLVLLSGGASALMAVPAPGLPLAAKGSVTRRLLAANASIGEINCVRKHLSAIKGGRLLARSSAPVVTLALSDVVGDDPSVIGSGPTVPDPTTFAEAVGILSRRGGRAAYPAEAMAVLERGARGRLPETPKPGDAACARGEYRVIGSAADAVRGARVRAEELGYRAVVLPAPVVGEARLAAATWLDEVRDAARGNGRPLCILSSGETTVEVAGGGRGGRNQEFALALVAALARFAPATLVASIGTDGVDGPTDAAGASADSTSLARASARGLDPLRYLEANDAWSFFHALGDLVRTGPTGTNVGDLQVALLGS
jgi:hydroxypyruvate reductase